MQKITEYVEKKILPAIALRGIVVFPNVVTSFELARKKSVAALKRAKDGDGRIFLVAQTDPSVLDPAVSDLQTVGVIARIDNSFKLPNGNVQVVVEGLTRADLQDISLDDNGLTAYVFVRNLSYEQLDEEAQIVSMKEAWAALTEYMKFTPNQSREVTDSARNINDAASLADYLASSFLVKAEDRQAVLDVYEPIERLNKFTEIIKAELEYMYLESDIQNKVRINLQRSQRDAYLREQLRVIHSELGSGEDEELLSEDSGSETIAEK